MPKELTEPLPVCRQRRWLSVRYRVRMNCGPRTVCLLTIFSLAACGGDTSWIQQYAAESTAANQTCTAKDYAACRQHLNLLLELLDGRADIVYRLARVDAALGNRTAAMTGLTVFSKMKLPFADPNAEPAFADLRANSEFTDILSRLNAARQPVSSSRPLLTMPEKDLVTEDIAYDPSGDRFFVSSIRHGKILRVARDGTASEFLAEGAPDVWAVLALGVDAKHRFLWATTAAMPENLHFKAEDKGRSALLRFSLADGALLKRYDLPRDTEHALGDLTLSPAGDVFVSDGHGPVYWVSHDDDRLQTLVPAGTFRSPQTPALSANGRTLFVPDYSRGISAFDLPSKQSRLVAHPRELSLGGIDGLYLAGQTMIAVQNGTSPARIIRMRLDSSHTRIEGFEVLESNSPELGAPTHGVVVGDRFYFIANSGWDRLNDDGQVKPGSTFESPTIRELPVHAKK
jgi:sugar lactone lactonase YvrE